MNQWGYFETNEIDEKNYIEKHFGMTNNSRLESLICELWIKQSIQQHLFQTFFSTVKIEGRNTFYNELSKCYNCIDKVAVVTIFRIVLDSLIYLKVYDTSQTTQMEDQMKSSQRALTDSMVSFCSTSLNFLYMLVERFGLQPNDLYSNLNFTSQLEPNDFLFITLIKIASCMRNKSLSLKILDFLSLLSKRSNVYIDSIAKTYWDQFCDTSFESDVEVVSQLPYSFGHLVSQNLSGSKFSLQVDSNRDLILEGFLKSIMNKTLDNRHDIMMQHFLLGHWADATLCGISVLNEYKALIQSLRFLLNQLASDVMLNTESKERLQSRRIDPSIEIKCLSVRTIPLAYDLILNLSNASYYLDQSRLRENLTTVNQCPNFNIDLNSSLDLLSIISSLTELFTENLLLFPDRSLGLTLKIASELLKTFESDIDAYFTQQIGFTQLPRKKVTQALFHQLKPLLDSFQNYAELLKCFSTSASEQPTEDELLNETSITNRKAIASLGSRCKGILSSLHDLNMMYNYNLPTTLENVGLSRLGTIERIEENQDDEKAKESKQVFIENINVVVDDEDDGDSFGVVGDWGNDEQNSLGEVKFIGGAA